MTTAFLLQARRWSDSGGALLCGAAIGVGWVVAPDFQPARIPGDFLKELQ